MMGHAGWRPGQLENEIKKGDWMMQSMTDDFVFNIQSNSMWEQAISSLDHNWANGANA
jgi:putative transcriptional regulator